jgi:hypothetical protein
MATSGQFLTVPPSSHRSSQHRRRDSARSSAQSVRAQRSATLSVASSSKMMLEDTPLGMPDSAAASPPPPSSSSTTTTKAGNDIITTTTTSSFSYPPQSSPRASQAQLQARPAAARAASSTPSIITPPANSNTIPPQSVQLSPRSIFRAMPFLLRLRSPPTDLMTMTCTSGGPRTHAVLSKCQIDKASQALTYNKMILCADAVNAEVLLRLARNELLERAQEANRQVTALVDEEYVSLLIRSFSQSAQHERVNDKLGSPRWRYTIRQNKSGDYNVQVRSPIHQTQPLNRMTRLISICTIRCSTWHIRRIARARIRT